MKTIVILLFCLTGIATAQVQLGYKSESIWFNHTGPGGYGTDELPLFNLYLTGGYKFSKSIFYSRFNFRNALRLCICGRFIWRSRPSISG